MDSRVALIGYGTGGAVFHAPLISSAPGLTLAAIVTGDPGRRASAADRYPGVRLPHRADDIWAAAGDYDLVVVTAPNRQHVPLARAALRAGLPVVVDKPAAVTAAQAQDLAALAEQRGLAVFPFHNRRWDGDFRTVRRLVEDGSLGTVRRLESRFERWRPHIKPGWKESADPADAGGILYDLGSHLIDQAVALFGAPARVYAELDVRRDGAQAHDDAFLALTYPGGLRCHLWMSAVAADLGPRFRVLGDRAAYIVTGLDGQEDALRAGHTPADERWGKATHPGHLGTPGDARPLDSLDGAYQDFYAGVAQAIRGRGPAPVPMADAVTGLRVIEAALRSAHDEQVVVVE